MLSLSNLVKAAKRCAYNPSISNEKFLNAFLEPYVEGGRVVARGGSDFYLDKHRTSKILNCEADVPLALRKVNLQHGLEGRVADGCAVLWDETLNPLYFEEFKGDVLSLIDDGDPLQRALRNRLKDKTDDRDGFLACALIGAIGLKNKSETAGLIWRKGTGSFGWAIGDIFRFGFSTRKKKKNLVVIPVDCGFDTHVTRGYEGSEIPRVSEHTVHGKWLTRMAQTGVLEPDLKKRISYELKELTPDDRGCYPIGTVVAIDTNKSVFLLLALSRFDDKGNARSTPSEISKAIDCLLEYYDCKGQGADMYLPLLGTGMSRAGLGSRESFEMITNAVTEKASFIGGSVTVVLLPEAAEELALIG